ncbi:MAG: cyclase family protein [bacterium]
MKIIDLSMNIQSHWRWPLNLEYLQSHTQGDEFQTCALKISMHAFTHVDTPLHILPEKITIDDVPLEQLIGPASIINIENVGPNQPITEEMLKKAGEHIEDGDIVILKTNWDKKRDYTTKEFWTESPYLLKEAAVWLANKNIKAVGFDFPQDFSIREIPQRHPKVAELPTHDIILRKGIYLIEYLCNLGKITVEKVQLFALPLKIVGAEASPARVAAIIS